MICLSNGHSFEYLAASGALAYDGRGWPWEWPLRWLGFLDVSLFTAVTKTLTAEPRRGNLRWTNPFRCVRLLKHGVVNAIGLTNPGLNWWIEKIAPRLQYSKNAWVCSIADDNPEVLASMAQRLNAIPIKAIEINASCPNTEQDLTRNVASILQSVRQVRQKSRHPIFLKLSVVHPYVSLVQDLADQIEAVAINSVPWKVAFPNEQSPLVKLGGGGVSGQVIQAWTWKMVEELAKHTSTPVIGPSVWNYEDLAALRKRGASAISFGSIFMRYPWRPTQFVRREIKSRS